MLTTRDTPGRASMGWSLGGPLMEISVAGVVLNTMCGGAVLMWRTVLYLLILSDFRAAFWKTAKHALRRGQIDGMLGAAFMGYHLIQFTREALRGDQNASYYSAKKRAAPMAVAKPPARQDEQVAA